MPKNRKTNYRSFKTELRHLDTAASLIGIAMKDLILISVDEFLHRKPNKVTFKAMNQSETGKGLKRFNSLEEMFEDLAI